MRGIARECGIELALVQYHFGEKLTLWSAVLDDVLGVYQAKLDDILGRVQDRRASERIAVFLEALIRHAATDTVFVGIMSHARINPGPDTDAFQERIRERSRDVVDLIRTAQAEGEVVAGDPVVLFYLMVGAALRIFVTAADVGDLTDQPVGVSALLDEHVRVCVSLFVRAGAPVELPPSTPQKKLSNDKYSAGKVAPGAPMPSAFYLLTNVEGVVRRHLDQELRVLDITQGQMIALIRIANEHRLSSAKLARLLDVSPQTVMLFVRALEDKGFVRRDVEARKRRVLPIELTATGEAVLTRLSKIVEAAEAALLDSLAFEERTLLRGLLARILRRHRPLALSEWSPLLGRIKI